MHMPRWGEVHAGRVVDVPDDHGRQLIAAHAAVEYETKVIQDVPTVPGVVPTSAAGAAIESASSPAARPSRRRRRASSEGSGASSS